MKKSLYIFASTLVLFACNKQEDINNEAIPTPAEEENIFSLSVSAPETKTNIAGAEDVQFEEGEQLAIIADGNTVVTLTALSSGRSVTFQGDIGGTTISDGAYIVYPSSYLNGSRKVVYPASNSSSHVVPMAGRVVKTEGAASATTASARLMHIGGIVKVVIADIPSIATAFTFSAKKGESDVAITGTYDLSFNGSGEPVLSNAASTGTEVSFSVSGGKNEFYIPIPNTECNKLTVSVKEGANTLFTKTSSRSESFGERASFLGLKEVSIDPTVYLYSHMTGWESDGDAGVMSYSSSTGTASLKLATLGGQYFRVKVVYPTAYYRIMGPKDNDVEDDSTSGTFSDITSVDDKKAVRISTTEGVYTISFDITDNSYEIDEEDDDFVLYIKEGSSYADSKQMNKGADRVYYVIDQASAFTLYYNHYSFSEIGGYDENDNLHWEHYGFGSHKWSGNTSSFSLILRLSDSYYHMFDENYQSENRIDGVYLNYNLDNDGTALTRNTHNKSIWTYEMNNNSTHYFSFWVGKSRWGTDSGLSSTEWNGVSASYNNFGGRDCWQVGAMKYLIVLNDVTGKLKFIKL